MVDGQGWEFLMGYTVAADNMQALAAAVGSCNTVQCMFAQHSVLLTTASCSSSSITISTRNDGASSSSSSSSAHLLKKGQCVRT
jgi:hypothetical protein